MTKLETKLKELLVDYNRKLLESRALDRSYLSEYNTIAVQGREDMLEIVIDDLTRLFRGLN